MLENAKGFLTNRDVREFFLVIFKVILAFIIFFIGFGLVEGFNVENMIQPNSFAKVLSFFLGIDLITDGMTKLARFNGLEVQNVKDVLEKGDEETNKADRRKGIEWVRKHNEEERQNELTKKRMIEEDKLLKKLSKIQVKYDKIKNQPYKKYRFIKRRKQNKYKNKIDKLNMLIDEIDSKNFVVDYDIVEFDDLLFKGAHETHKKKSKKKRFNEDATTSIKKVFRFKNFLQSLLMFGLQGFILMSIEHNRELYSYLSIFILAIIVTGISSYAVTYIKITDGSWLYDQREKLKDLEKMNRETIH